MIKPLLRFGPDQIVAACPFCEWTVHQALADDGLTVTVDTERDVLTITTHVVRTLLGHLEGTHGFNLGAEAKAKAE